MHVTVTSALVSLLLPPSHNLILFSAIAGGGVSIADLFAAGIVPALLLAVGIWSAVAAKNDRSKLWVAPAAFVAAMLVGATAGYTAMPLPLVETGIALSVAVLGLLILARVELSTLAGAGLVALFAVYHGHAHGAAASGSIAAYMAGFALTTASLHFAGIGLGSAILRLRFATPVLGGAIAAAGAYLLAA